MISAQTLQNVTDKNHFHPSTEIEATAGNAVDVYLRLVDLQQLTSAMGFHPAGLRYIPDSGATMSVEFLSIDDAKVVTRAASNPFPDDRSIWKVSVLSSDGMKGTVSLKLTLTEGSKVSIIYVPAALLFRSFGDAC